MCVHPCACVWTFVVWACEIVRDLWRDGVGEQAGEHWQLLEHLQGVCRATAQVPRMSGWMS